MTRLTILHTNDLHGRVEQLTRIATLVRRIRREVEAAGGLCLFVDAGDAEDTTLLESSLTKGSSMNAMLRGAGCDYVALGNSIPLRYGPQAIADMAKHLGRPLVCANFCDERGEIVAGLEPFAIHEFDSIKLGIVGLTAPIAAYASFFKLQVAQPETILPTLIEKAKARGAKPSCSFPTLLRMLTRRWRRKSPAWTSSSVGTTTRRFLRWTSTGRSSRRRGILAASSVGWTLKWIPFLGR
jgi:2',3'-cyclic-nucleotide 2'-phosphodiesterase (5'-nucleotidase family)